MNSLVVAGISIFLLLFGYIFYSRKVKEWIGLDEEKTPPSVSLNDGVDYVPAKHWSILFGHHFSSIAGAAPIIGPVIACLYWGWLPSIIWIVVGGVFFGAVHDFTALVLSLRNEGKSITVVAESVLGRTSRILFSIFAFLALILVVAVFAAAAGETLAAAPQFVIPTFGLIADALIISFLIYRVGLSIPLCSVIGLSLLAAEIITGYYIPIELPVENVAGWWTVILLIYGLVASVTPVHILLQPRDYLSGCVLVVGILFGFLGLILTRPEINSPAVTSFSSAKGFVWPMLMVTIACGAISGFHSLVASGTTSKQLPRMKDARVIGYGGMIAECILSIMAVMAVTAGLYWESSSGAGHEGLIYPELYEKEGWITTFGTGYGQLTKLFFGELGLLVGVTMLNTFIMTTLDTATRITRYIYNELFGESLGIPYMKNKYIATLAVGILAGSLALGNWQAIWPIFGGANQLIASLVLIVVSVYLLSRKRYFLFTAIPALTMLASTITALSYKTYVFTTAEEPKIVLATIAVILIILALFLTYTAVFTIIRWAKSQRTI